MMKMKKEPCPKCGHQCEEDEKGPSEASMEVSVIDELLEALGEDTFKDLPASEKGISIVVAGKKPEEDDEEEV